MKNKKKFAIASLVMSIVSLIPLIISPNSLNGTLVVVIIAIFVAIVSAIFGFIGKSASKGMAISGIVISIISCVVLCFSLIGFQAIKNATDCVDNGNETSTCNYLGEELEVPNSFLREDQMKK